MAIRAPDGANKDNDDAKGPNWGVVVGGSGSNNNIHKVSLIRKMKFLFVHL